MESEMYKARKSTIVFSPAVPLANDFYKNTSSENLKEASKVLLHAYTDVFGVSNTPMGDKLTAIFKHPEKVLDGEAMFGVEPTKKKGEAIYSVKITTERETNIFSLRVGDFTELSYIKNDRLVERHYQKGKEVIHEIA